MGAFTDPNFVKEFSYRTKINYYTMLRDYSESAEKREKADKMINIIHQEMLDEEFSISKYYDVTQLINSLIGLLVFPEQVYFDCLSDDENDLKKNFPTLYDLVNKPEYICSYKQNYHIPKFTSCLHEKKTPKKIMNHLRNSIAHKQLMIRPLRGRFDKNNIETIVFEDACVYVWKNDDNNYEGGTWIADFKNRHFQRYKGYSYLNYEPEDGKEVAVFHLEVPVSDLEKLLMEICDFLVESN